MGIKGIYRELGPGQRVSLAKLATEHLESTGRPLRLAIDIAIWQFQNQAAKGGSNPAIRTLFYRLVRLLGHAIQPIFVFDGPEKPRFKRNKRSGRGDGVASAMAKRLIRLFGLPVHQAPGEAEAECALLQQNGVVDAVLSEDVDTLMFGCTRVLRNWSSEGSRGSKTPTHVTMYDTTLLDAGTVPGLDREAMVLVAMMSGGDYIPEGVPGCGVKLACEIARAGFGKSLCQMSSATDPQMTSWKESLLHELATNESKFFRTRHKAFTMPSNFPDIQVLRHYTHPIVSPLHVIEKLKNTLVWSPILDLAGLRTFVDETFDWTYRIGAVKLIRVLSPSMLAQMLLQRSVDAAEDNFDLSDTDQAERRLVRAITGRRKHFSVDAMPELRVSHLPLDIVPLDLSMEVEEVIEHERQGLALSNPDILEPGLKQLEDDKTAPTKSFDPKSAQPVWLPEALVKLGAPLSVEDWEEAERAKQTLGRGKKTGTKKKGAKGDSGERTVMDRWLKTTKGLSETPAATLLAKRPPIPSATEPATLHHRTGAKDDVRPQGLGLGLVPSERRAIHTRATPSRSKPSQPPSTAGAGTLPESATLWARSGSHDVSRVDTSRGSAEVILLSSSPAGPSSPPSPEAVTPRHRTSASGSSRADVSSDQNPPCNMRAAPKSPPTSPSKRCRQPAKSDMTRFTQTSITSYAQRLHVATKKAAIYERSTGDHQSSQSTQDVPAVVDIPLTVAPGGTGLQTQGGHGQVTAARSEALRVSNQQHRTTDTEEVTSRTRKIYIPRLSAAGFIKEVIVSTDEAADLLNNPGQETARPRNAWKSRVSLIDLTQSDGPD